MMKRWTYFRIILFSFLMAACSRNPLGEDLTQTIVNLGFVLSQTCTTSFNQDLPFTCAVQTDDPTLTNLVFTLEPGTTCTWAAISASSGVITGTPNDNQVGNCDLVVGSRNTQRRALNLVVPVVVKNVAPVFTPIANPANIIEDASVSVIRTAAQVQTTEEGFGTYGFAHASTTAPRCIDNSISLTINSADGAISFQPAANYFGTCYIKASFDDGNGQANSVATSEFSITVTPVNDAPTLATIPDQSMIEGTSLAINLNANDVDNILTCSSPSLTAVSSNGALVNAAGMVFSGTIPNCILTVTPLALQNGLTTITVTATDGILSVAKSFDLTVVPFPDPPVLAPIANQSGTEDIPLVFSINISDPDTVLACNSTFLSATSSNSILLPVSNIIFSGSTPNCTVTLNPAANANGVSNLVISLSDGTTTVTQSLSATFVAVNDPPVISAIGNQTQVEDSTLVVNFTISDVDSALTCTGSVSATTSNATLLPVANIIFAGTAPNCTATINPAADQFGNTNLNFIVSDGSLTATSPFSLTVTPVNDAPIISAITNQTINEDNSVIINFTISDVDNVLTCGSSVSVASSNTTLLPLANMVLSGTAPNCTVTLNPALNQFGNTNIVLTVSDSILSNTSPFTLTVNPVNDAPIISAIANQTINEDTPTAPISFTITDVDSVLLCSSMNLSVTSSNTALLPIANIVFSGTAPNCTVTMTPAADQFGSTNLVVTVFDNGTPNLQATSALSLTVNPVNDAPVISAISAQTTTEGSVKIVNFNISDVDNILTCTGSVSAASSNTTLLPTANIVFSGTAPNCVATLSPVAFQNGISNVTFTVTDTLLTASSPFTFTVTAVDDPPVISVIANQTTNEDNSIVINFNISDIDSILSCTGSMSATSSNAALLNASSQIIFAGTVPNCTATLNPALNQYGITNIVFTVTDGTTPVNQPFTFTVNPVNDAPVISAIANQSTNEDTATAAIAFTITDVDNVLSCTTSVSATSSNTTLLPVANIVFGGTAPNCTVTFNPALNQNGFANIVVSVTDGALTASSSLALTVNPVNDAPVISAISNQTTNEDTATGAVVFTITDVDNILDCTASVSATTSNPGLLPVANIVLGGTAPNCTVTMTPTLNNSGVANIVITVTDGLLQATSPFSLTVNPVNDAPVISTISNQTTNEDTATAAIAFTITDVDNTLLCTAANLSVTSSNLALLPLTNIVFAGTAPNCTVTMSPTLNNSGVSNLVITVADNGTPNLQATTSFSLTVNPVNDAPVISTIASQTMMEGGTLVVNFTISDVDSTLNCLTSMSATSSNVTMLPNANIVFSGTAPNCVATINPAANQNGSANIALAVTDGFLSANSSFALTVTPYDDPPTISAIADAVVNEDTSLMFNFTINDIDSVLNCTTSMSATSSNTTLLPVANITFSGTAPNCTATINPALNQNGISNLVFTVTDGTTPVPRAFKYTVNAINDAPVISAISNQTINEDSATAAIPFTITDVDNTLSCTTSVSATSSNTTLLPVANIVIAGTAPNCTVTMTPTLNGYGSSNVVITVTDGLLQATSPMSLTVNAVNDAPVISTIANQTTNEDTATAAIAFTITDVDSILLCTSANLSVTSSNVTLLPTANIVFGGTAPNCTVTMNPALNQFGSSNVVITVSDNGTPNLMATSPFSLTVNSVNDAPVISAIANQTTNEDTATAAIPFTITDVDNILSCMTSVSATSSNSTLLPVANIVFGGTAPNCTVTMNPALNQFGVSNVVITVTDGLLQATSPLSLTVNAVNDAPVISAISNQFTTEDTATTAIPFTITDVDNILSCATSVSATSSNTSLLPVANISIGGTAPNCTVTMTPTLNSNGVSNVVITVTDGLLQATSPFSLTVSAVNNAPVISAISNQTTNEDTATAAIPFTITDVDSPLLCTSANLSVTSSNTILLPITNIVFGGTAPNCTVTLNPALNQFGSSNVVITVADNGIPNLTATSPFTLTVNSVNDAPVISSISNKTTNEDTATAAIPFTITDVDNTLSCTTSVSATSSDTTLLPMANIVFGGTAPNCTVTMSPALNQFGLSNIVITVTDGLLQASSPFSLTVNAVNDAPVISTISNQTTNEDTATAAIPFTITDVDNILSCTTSVSATSSNTALLPVANIVIAGTAPNCTVTMNPALNQFGVSNIVITVTDGLLQATSPFTLTVNSVNDAPVISAIANQTTNEDTSTAAIAFTITDVDSTLLCTSANLSATSSNATLLPVANIVFGGTAPNCTVTLNPALNQFGSSNVAVVVADNGTPNLTATSPFSLTVNAVNDAPVISTISNQTTNEDTATAAIPFTITDVDNILSCTTSVSATSSNTALLPVANIVIAGTAPNCTVTMNPALNQFGVSNIVITVTDGLLQATSPFTLTVNAVNDAPVISAIANQTTNEDTTTAAIAFTITDVDSTLLCTSANLSATSSNTTLLPVANIVFGGTAPNCTVTMNPALNQFGTSNVAVVVADNGAPNLTATSPFSLTVNPINDPPVISTISNQTTNEDTATAAIPFTITDPDNTLSCTTSVSVTSSNTSLLPVANIVFAGTAPNCTVTMTPTLNNSGSSNIVITVTDGLLQATSPFSLTVVAVNDAPVISAIANQTTNEDTTTAAIAFTITDVDSVLLCTSVNLTATSSNATLLPVANIVFGGTAPNCTVTMSPALNQFGSANVVITVADNGTPNLLATSPFTLTVNAVNDAPVISAIADQTTNEDTITAAIPFTITDVDNTLSCATSVSATSSNTALLPVANIVFGGTAPNCTVTMNPALNQFGSTNVVITVTDGLLNATSPFVLNVTAVNDAPVISSIVNQTTSEDNPITIPFTITDVDSVLLCTTANLSITSSDTTLLPIANVVYSGTAPNCIATLSPAADANGVTNLVLTVMDNGTPNLQASRAFTFTVTPVNDPPVMSAFTDVTILEDGTLIKNFTITDIDSVLNCVTSMTSSPSNTTILPVANVVFSGTAPNCTATISPAANQFGIVDILMTVSDGALINNRLFTLTITSVNDAPVISSVTNQNTNEDTATPAIAFTITDVDNTLSCTTSVSMTSTNTALIPVSNVVFSGTAPNCSAVITPAANAFGTSNLAFVVSDGVGGTANAAFVITVNSVNDAPVISAISNQTTNEDTATAAIAFTITDVDNTLSCATSVSATSSNTTLLPVANIVFAGTAPNCTVTMNPALNQFGLSNVVITVTDGLLQATSPFSLTVNSVNDAPVISTVANQTTNEDTATAGIPFTITDVDNTLSCTTSMSATSSNTTLLPVANIVFAGTAPNCTVTMNPALNQFGASNVVLTVTDGIATATSSFSLTVISVNDAPVLSSIANQTLKTDGSVILAYTLTDVDNVMNCSTSVTAASGTTTIIANADIVKGGTAPNCTLTITPSLNAAGSSTISVAGTDGMATTTITFSVTTLSVTALAVSPTPFSLVSAGSTLQLTATATYSDSSTANVTANGNANWSSSATGVATVNNTTSKGLVTAVTGSGNVNITAIHKGLSAVAAGTVYMITGITVSQSVVSGGINSKTAITAQAILNPSGTTDITNTAAWTTSNASVATVSGGLISFLSAGTATVTASYNGFSQTISVTVQNKTLSSIAVTPATSSVAVYAIQNFVATATYSDASTQVVTTGVTWSSSNSGIATVSNSAPTQGRATGVATGSVTVTASIGAVSGTATLSVNAATLVSIAISPRNALVTTSGTYQLMAIGTFSDASTSILTDQVTWSSSDTTVATISNSIGTRGQVTTPTFTGYKSTIMTATLNAVSDSTLFGVNSSTINSILITPTVTVTPGSTYNLKAWANLADGGTIDITNYAVWTSGTPAAVTVSNAVDSKGLVNGVANGSSVISAVYGGVTGTRTVTVAASALMTETGIGLLGEYFVWTGVSPPASPFLTANKKGERIDATINFSLGGSGTNPAGASTMYSIRWTGFYKATSTTNFFCTYSGDGVRLYINGSLVIDNWTDHGPTYDCTANIPLTVGTKYSVEMHYYENTGNSQYHLLRSSISAADASSTTKAIPQADLYTP